MAVEPVLVSQFFAVHGVVSLEGVFERPPPSVVNAHGIVGGHGTVEKRPLFAALIAGSQFVKYVGGFPEIEHFVFVFDDIDPSIDFFELSLFLRHCSSLSKESDNSR